MKQKINNVFYNIKDAFTHKSFRISFLVSIMIVVCAFAFSTITYTKANYKEEIEVDAVSSVGKLNISFEIGTIDTEGDIKIIPITVYNYKKDGNKKEIADVDIEYSLNISTTTGNLKYDVDQKSIFEETKKIEGKTFGIDDEESHTYNIYVKNLSNIDSTSENIVKIELNAIQKKK